METRASHVLIGAFALATLILGFLFVLWVGKLSLDREWDYYDILFTEAVTGLTVGGAVQYNGIQIGEVRKLSLDPKNPSRVIAHVRVAGDTPVKVDTKAKLAFTGLTGVAVIQLSRGSAKAAPLERTPGQTWPTIVADTSALQKLLTSSEDIITSLNDVIIPKLKELFTLSYAQAMLVQSAFFAAYFVISIPAAAIVRRFGYMRAAVVGLGFQGPGHHVDRRDRRVPQVDSARRIRRVGKPEQ